MVIQSEVSELMMSVQTLERVSLAPLRCIWQSKHIGNTFSIAWDGWKYSLNSRPLVWSTVVFHLY